MRVLVLGTGAAQSDLFEYCKGKGHEVVGCSNRPSDKWIKCLDHYEEADIKDRKAVFDIAEKYKVDLIYSAGSSVAMPTVAEVSEKLGLPHFVSTETAEICASKERLRECLGDRIEGNIPYKVFTELEEALTYEGFPAMMKPVDSQGQRGCFRVGSKEDIREYFAASQSYSQSGKVVIEEYVEGDEVSVNAYFYDGRLVLCLISDRLSYAEFPGGIIKEHRIPSRSIGVPEKDGIAARIVKLAADSAEKLGISNGPAYYQIKIREDGSPALIEADARLDGCHMWRLIKYYCGIDLIDITFRHLINDERINSMIIPEKEPGFRLSFINEKPGNVFSKSKINMTDAEYVCLYYDEGDIVSKKNGHYEKCGYIIKRI
jgi:biotin carboxylase